MHITTIINSMLIDLIFCYLLLTYVITGWNFDCLFSIAIFYLTRAFCMNLSKWPVPKHYIFEYPGIPSILISYEKANDLYFSGHTGSMTIIFFFSVFRNYKIRSIFMFFQLSSTMIFLLITNIHYTNDVLIGFLIGFT